MQSQRDLSALELSTLRIGPKGLSRDTLKKKTITNATRARRARRSPGRHTLTFRGEEALNCGEMRHERDRNASAPPPPREVNTIYFDEPGPR